MKKKNKLKAEALSQKLSLPTHRDFSRGKLDLDAECAWKHFGGKSLDEAYLLFCERPDIYQEDFMFMENPAFIFYFPAIDRYLRNIEKTEEFTDSQALILCQAIALRLEFRESLEPIHQSILDLCDYVCSNVFKFCYGESDRSEISRQYEKLRKTICKGTVRKC